MKQNTQMGTYIIIRVHKKYLYKKSVAFIFRKNTECGDTFVLRKIIT